MRGVIGCQGYVFSFKGPFTPQIQISNGFGGGLTPVNFTCWKHNTCRE